MEIKGFDPHFWQNTGFPPLFFGGKCMKNIGFKLFHGGDLPFFKQTQPVILGQDNRCLFIHATCNIQQRYSISLIQRSMFCDPQTKLHRPGGDMCTNIGQQVSLHPRTRLMSLLSSPVRQILCHVSLTCIVLYCIYLMNIIQVIHRNHMKYY